MREDAIAYDGNVELFYLDDRFVSDCGATVCAAAVVGSSGAGLLTKGLFEAGELSEIMGQLRRVCWRGAGRTGYVVSPAVHEVGGWVAGPGAAVGESGAGRVASWRASCFSERVADTIWGRLSGSAGALAELAEVTQAELPPCEAGTVWTACGVSPLLRFIRYPEGGYLLGHYDSPYVWSVTRRSALSLLIYISTDSAVGGATRFLYDDAEHEGGNYLDWDRATRIEDVSWQVQVSSGDAVLFAHRMLHDSEPVVSGEKLCLRTDIIFEQLDEHDPGD